MKTHYAEMTLGRAWPPESPEPEDTFCGLSYTISPTSDNIHYVDCKNCLKIYELGFPTKPPTEIEGEFEVKWVG